MEEGRVISSTYKIIKKIGAGGGGVVYLAEHLRLNKKVVLKADKRKTSAKQELLRREVDVLKDLSNRYIPQVYDYFTENGVVCTVIDYIEGESLDKPLKRGERFSQAQVLKWAGQLLEALAYMHSPTHGDPPRGIVHSDIKPANIMLRPNGDICLIDFNIALALGEENLVGLTQGYASPEHYGLDFSSDTSFTGRNSSFSFGQRGSRSRVSEVKTKRNVSPDAETATIDYDLDDRVKVIMSTGRKSDGSGRASSSSGRVVVPDARSDIYSLGATLYHILSGVRPPKDATEVIPLSGEGISPQVSWIIQKAMMPNPNLRWQSAEEMLYAVNHLRENDPREIKRKRKLAAGLGTAAVLSVLGLSSLFMGLKGRAEVQNSLKLAEYSGNALEEGNIDGAVSYALESLPPKKGILSAYTAQAEKALADSLGVYDLSDGFKAWKTVSLPSEALKINLSPNGKTGAAVCAFEVVLFDTESGEIIAELPTVKSALAEVEFIDDDTIACAGEKGLTVYDIKEDKAVWSGEAATAVAVSADGSRIAGLYGKEGKAVVYNADGSGKKYIDFEGRSQRSAEKDTFADPLDNLFELSPTGDMLAVSFADGGLNIYYTDSEGDFIEIYDKTDYSHFEGGFTGDYFAFSASKSGESDFGVIDLKGLELTAGYTLDSRIKVKASEDGLYLANKNIAVSMNPATGEETEAAYAAADITDFSACDGEVIALMGNVCDFYDKDADLAAEFKLGKEENCFTALAGDYALVGGNSSPKLRIFKRKSFEGYDLCGYEKGTPHDEARINEDKKRLLLFNYKGLSLYDLNGVLIKQTEIPDAEKVVDQQYCRESGNLAVIYDDALRIYSGETGDILFEKTGLKSVFYAPYGISVYDGEKVSLIDDNTAEVIKSQNAEGDFAAICGGGVLDNRFLNYGSLLGAAEIDGECVFAVERDGMLEVDIEGKKIFEAYAEETETEAFFTHDYVIISPLHGTPKAYSLKNGKKAADLEEDAYLAYITETEDFIISQYISAQGEYYGIALSKDLEPLAYMPNLTDICGDFAYFDCGKGIVRKTKLYSLDELISRAEAN